MTARSSTGRSAFADHRHAVRLTQEELARRADCSVAYIRLLDGGWTPDPDRSPAYDRVVRVLHQEPE